ncbi:hypothetical protein SPW_7286 [Streptomyces sp. W007]|nr:hypothetical protein SPW_7286 [Streptomyces sp. W007]
MLVQSAPCWANLMVADLAVAQAFLQRGSRLEVPLRLAG